MDNRRSNIEIIADILRLGQTSQTGIMYGCDISYFQLRKYLRFLLERGFLKPDESANSRRTYAPTAQGEQLLVYIDRVKETLQLRDRDADSREEVETRSLHTGAEPFLRPQQPGSFQKVFSAPPRNR